jgi:uncharacterized protein YjbI with pentapeptide repeats
MADQNSKTCAYKDCKRDVNPHYRDSKYCIFHAPLDKKGSIEAFEQEWRKQKEKRDFNCRGYVFPIPLDFKGETFNEFVDFSHAVFEEEADFSKVDFKGIWMVGVGNICASFTKSEFKKHAIFNKAAFSNESYFNQARFIGRVDFVSTEFLNESSFTKAEFFGWADFYEAKFNWTDFTEVHFSRKANFTSTQFLQNTFFFDTKINGKVFFDGIKFKKNIFFDGIIITAPALLYFRNPKFEKSDKGNISASKIIFENVSFIPYRASFENIVLGDEWSKIGLTDKPAVIFRHCQLEDVYFSNNDMSIFSFYKSSFDKARFISNKYGKDDYNSDRVLLKKYDRENIILEERLLHHLRENIKNNKEEENIREKYSIEGLDDYKEIAGLYRRMKTALDYTKDFEEAGKFYFNEYEMKRRALKDDLRGKGILKNAFSKRPIYYLYKIFAGYGEKPLWSFIWFIFFSFLFAVAHLFNGFEITKDDIINYSFNPSSWNNIFKWQTIWDFIQAWFYSIFYILPRSYIPVARGDVAVSNIWDILLMFSNSVVLLIMILFIGIGLKRHFRRF